MPDWDKIFTQKGYVFIDPHPDMARLVTIFQEGNVKKILDLGCGTGRNLVSLSKAGFDVIGFDFIKEGISIVRCGGKNEMDRFYLSPEVRRQSPG